MSESSSLSLPKNTADVTVDSESRLDDSIISEPPPTARSVNKGISLEQRIDAWTDVDNSPHTYQDNFQVTTKDTTVTRPTSTKKALICCIVFVFIVLIIITVGISVAAVQLSKSAAADSEREPTTSGTTVAITASTLQPMITVSLDTAGIATMSTSATSSSENLTPDTSYSETWISSTSGLAGSNDVPSVSDIFTTNLDGSTILQDSVSDSRTSSAGVVTSSSTSVTFTTSRLLVTTASVTSMMTTTRPSQTSFFGGFTLQNNPQFRQDILLPESKIYNEYNELVCRNIISILMTAGFDSSSACIAQLRRSDFVVIYQVRVNVRSNETLSQAQTAASASIVKALAGSYNYAALNLDKATVRFFNTSDMRFEMNNTCHAVSKCSGLHSFCSPAINDYACVCSPGYQSPTGNGDCTDCSPDAIRCTSGATSLCAVKCDGRIGCQDSRDEQNCTCSSSQYQCRSASGGSFTCQDQSTWCDGFYNCPDKSDEDPSCRTPNKRCPTESIGLCKATGRCLFPIHRCNWFQDCPDDFDETNCTCPSYGYPCQNGRCIYKSWLCDGNRDCPLGDDESTSAPANCNQCDPVKQFRCAVNWMCIDISGLCDGTPQCLDSSDETDCFVINDTTVTRVGSNLLTMKLRGLSRFFICFENWSEVLSNRVCQLRGFRSAQSTNDVIVSDTAALFVTINSSTAQNDSLLTSAQIKTCSSGRAVSIICSPQTCGRRRVPNIPIGYILDGQQAVPGAWPWQVQLFAQPAGKISSMLCGGELITDRWVMTAAHCIQNRSEIFGYPGTVRSTDVYVRMGSILRNESDPASVKRLVRDVIPHPNYQTGFENPPANDIALLQLAEPMPLSDTIQPICLPTANVDLKQFKVCFSTGFGQTSALSSASSPQLRQARMNILTYSACVAYTPFFKAMDPLTTFCIGTVPTERDRNVGGGDSGGPLSCVDQNGVWTVIGVNSYGDLYKDYSVVASVPAYINWITSTISSNISSRSP